MIRRPPRSTQSRSSAASDVYKRQTIFHPNLRSRTCGTPKRHASWSNCDFQEQVSKVSPEGAWSYGRFGCAVRTLRVARTPCPDIISCGACQVDNATRRGYNHEKRSTVSCLLYTSDAADDLLCVDLGG